MKIDSKPGAAAPSVEVYLILLLCLMLLRATWPQIVGASLIYFLAMRPVVNRQYRKAVKKQMEQKDKQMTLQNRYTRQSEIGRNGYEGEARSGQVQPAPRSAEIVQDSRADSLTEFYTKHNLRRTAPKQARLLTRTIRQGELVAFQADVGMRVYNSSAESALGHMVKLSELEERCVGRVSPQVAERVASMTERGLDFFEGLPTAATQRFLRSYALD